MLKTTLKVFAVVLLALAFLGAVDVATHGAISGGPAFVSADDNETNSSQTGGGGLCPDGTYGCKISAE